MESAFGILAIFALVFTNGFFVAAEFSFVGARRTRIAQLASEGRAGAKAAERAISHLDSYIAATQLGITLSSLGLGWIGESALTHLIEPLFHGLLPEPVFQTVGIGLSIALSFTAVTMLHIILGELTPKAIALQHPEETSMWVAQPTSWFLAVFRPVIALMNGIGNALVRALGFSGVSEHQRAHSAEELEMLVHSSTEAGVLQESEEQILRRVFDFSEVTLEHVMQPRVEIDALALTMPLDQAVRFAAERRHSRYPVYDETLDQIVGVLHTKDVFERILRDPALISSHMTVSTLRDALRVPLFVPATVGVDHVLERMQRHRTHLAIVVDEYGGTAGVATMEDILELIVGDVQDEFDAERAHTGLKPGDDMVIDGLENLADLEERFGRPDGPTRSYTIGGYVAERLDRIPSVGDYVAYGRYRVIVEAMDSLRVARVRFAAGVREKE
jgi:CBS domain containing-hemolysin-like protein